MGYFRIVGAVLIVVGLWGSLVHAQAGPGWYGPPGMTGQGPSMMLLVLRGVNLTAEQEVQIQQIRANHRATLRDLFGQLREAQEAMGKRLFAPGELQEDDLAPQMQRVALLRNQLAQQGLKTLLEIRAVLTPEQLAKGAQLMQQMQALRSQMRDLFEQDQ